MWKWVKRMGSVVRCAAILRAISGRMGFPSLKRNAKDTFERARGGGGGKEVLMRFKMRGVKIRMPKVAEKESWKPT